MLQFVLVRPENVAAVDNADITIDCSALPANVDVVSFAAIEGKIEYNDQPSVRTVFTDPSPYQPHLNAWMTAYAAATPALLLAQAKLIKKDLVDSIFHHKRRLPYTLGPWQYDARDEAVDYGTALLNAYAILDSSGIEAAFNPALSSIVDQINSYFVSMNNSMAGSFAHWITTNCLNMLTQTTYQFHTVPASGTVPGKYVGIIAAGGNAPQFGMGNMSSVSNIPGATVSSGTIRLLYSGSITMQPLNAATPQAIPADTYNQVLSGIGSRRNSLNNNRLTKQFAIDALTTIPAVVAYDATAGWSF